MTKIENIPLVNYKGVKINNRGSKIYFTRHAQSWANVGHQTIDCTLSTKGVEQAGRLGGHFQLVMCSPMRRALGTLHHSQITYDQLMVVSELREVRHAISDCLPLEYRLVDGDFQPEPDDEFRLRVDIFHRKLELACHQHDNILIIGHAYYFNSWYRRGCYPSPPNAQILHLL